MNPVEDVRAGWRAPIGSIMTGAALALIVSVPLALVLGRWTELGLAASFIVLAVQLSLGYVLAGRLARRR